MTHARGDVSAPQPPAARVAPLTTLLERLALSGDVAREYERLRQRLAAYFRVRYPAEAEALADEAIDRLARRLDDGTAVQSLAGYALGIARLLVLETDSRRAKERNAIQEALLDRETMDPEPAESDPATPALVACLEAIGAESAAFILEYYAADSGAARIARRQEMAERREMSLNALRNRALRIRIGLERCVRARLRSDEIANPDTEEIMLSDSSP